MRISVIMPVFNMAKTLSISIESWLKQSVDEKELICVDDCSKDASLQILESYASVYDNIKVCSLEHNSGAGIARNEGMKIARGEYISFLDADDEYLNDCALEVLLRYAYKDNCKIVGGMLKRLTPDGVVTYGNHIMELELGKSYVDLDYISFQEDYYFQRYIFKKEFLEQKELYFPPYRRYQDPPFLVRALYNSERVRIVNVEVYLHKEGYKMVNYDIVKLTGLIDGLKDVLSFSEENNLDLLFDRTMNRINEEYYHQIYYGIKMRDPKYLIELSKIFLIAKRNERHLDALEYMFFLDSNDSRYDDYRHIIYLRKLLPGKKRVALYGAGGIGNLVFNEFSLDENYNIVCWVDKYRKDEIEHGICIKDVNCIVESIGDWDCVIICLSNEQESKEVCVFLKSMGICGNSIIQWTDVGIEEGRV